MTQSATTMDKTTSPLPSRASDFFALMKPRVMTLVIFTGAAGMYLAPHTCHPLQAFMAILCLSAGAGAAGALNMYLEIDVDSKMHRTQNRPLVRGVITPSDAAAFGIIISLLSVLLMGLSSNWVAAGWLAFSIFFYVVIYTLILKPNTVQNIVIGGAAGAFPPVIGWAAMTGHTPLEAWTLFAIIFLWTPPHFWSLSLWCAEDYKRANIPMLPNVAGPEATRRQIAFYGALVVLISFVPCWIGLSGSLYFYGAIPLNIAWIGGFLLVYWRGADKDFKRLFALSIFYLFLIFLMLILDHAGGFHVPF